MAFEVTRIYKNAATDTLRVDSIYMDATSNTIATGTARRTYYRRLSTSYLYGPADRDVASIEVVTTADSAESSSGNITWVEWTTPTSGSIRCDMSDLPDVGNTV